MTVVSGTELNATLECGCCCCCSCWPCGCNTFLAVRCDCCHVQCNSEAVAVPLPSTLTFFVRQNDLTAITVVCGWLRGEPGVPLASRSEVAVLRSVMLPVLFCTITDGLGCVVTGSGQCPMAGTWAITVQYHWKPEKRSCGCTCA
jgi:hypothetical protein